MSSHKLRVSRYERTSKRNFIKDIEKVDEVQIYVYLDYKFIKIK